jgi:hypothetical protein
MTFEPKRWLKSKTKKIKKKLDWKVKQKNWKKILDWKLKQKTLKTRLITKTKLKRKLDWKLKLGVNSLVVTYACNGYPFITIYTL